MGRGQCLCLGCFELSVLLSSSCPKSSDQGRARQGPSQMSGDKLNVYVLTKINVIERARGIGQHISGAPSAQR